MWYGVWEGRGSEAEEDRSITDWARDTEAAANGGCAGAPEACSLSVVREDIDDDEPSVLSLSVCGSEYGRGNGCICPGVAVVAVTADAEEDVNEDDEAPAPAAIAVTDGAPGPNAEVLLTGEAD